MSRRYGGIHFRAADLTGRLLGRLVAFEAGKKRKITLTDAPGDPNSERPHPPVHHSNSAIEPAHRHLSPKPLRAPQPSVSLFIVIIITLHRRHRAPLPALCVRKSEAISKEINLAPHHKEPNFIHL